MRFRRKYLALNHATFCGRTLTRIYIGAKDFSQNAKEAWVILIYVVFTALSDKGRIV